MDIYVGNIPHRTTEDQLRDLFVPFGEVISAKIMKDKITGDSRGFGFVRMPDTEQAKAAIAALNGSMLEKRELRVNEAKPMEPRAPGSGPRNSFGGSSDRGSGYRSPRY